MEICSRMTGYERLEDAFLIHTDNAAVRLQFVTDEIIRVRASFDHRFDEESYVLMTTAWEDRLDPLFRKERNRISPVSPTVEESEAMLVFTTAKLRLEVERDPICIRLRDTDGIELYSSLAGNPFTLDSNRRITHYSCMDDNDCFYGFGEKGGRLNKNGELIRERATDALGYDPTGTDTLYKHVPFFIRLSRKTKKAVGLFYHNFYESVFNLGREKSNYWPRYAYWQADGGDIDLFLIGGNSLKRIIDNYTLLTGRPALLPKRALGYQASSMYYAELAENSDAAILDFVETVREEGFPIDGFHLSSGYTAFRDRRCVFHWNRRRFPNPEAFFCAMNEKSVQTVPNVKPGFLTEHPRYGEFQAKGVFLRDSKKPEEPALGRWWGGSGAFWDFTSPSARELWKKELTEHILKVGTDSVWNDNCEYDGILDRDALASFDGEGGTAGQLKPVMSTLMCKVSGEAVTEHNPGARPYIVCRSGSAGIQKYAQTWCGDNFSSWETLRYNIPMITGMGLSGQPNEGADIGGFAGPAPDEELFLRWVQNGIFQPRFSIHSANSDNTVTEPWMYPGSEHLIREAMLLRYRFLPYLYSAEYEASRTGAPIMRALVYEFQEDERVWDESFDFLFGRDLLVANVLEPGAKDRTLYLPKGCRWYDWNDNYRCHEGGQTVTVPVTRETIPLFIREGAIIPMADHQPMSMERDPVRALRLILAPGRSASGCTIYDDDGVSNDFQSGICRKTEIRMSGTDCVEVAFSAEGAYPDTVERVTVELISRDRCPLRVCLGEEELGRFTNRKRFEEAEIGWYYCHEKHTALIRYPNPKKDITLSLSFKEFDLIGMEQRENQKSSGEAENHAV